MVRLGRRALLALGAYAAFILAMIIAGFLGAAVGIWASILWAVIVIAAAIIYLRHRSTRTAPE